MGFVVYGYKCVSIIKTVLCLMTSPCTDYRIELFFSGKMFNVHLILCCHLVGMFVLTFKITLIHYDQLEQFKCQNSNTDCDTSSNLKIKIWKMMPIYLMVSVEG